MRWFYLLVVGLTIGFSPCVGAEEQGFVPGETLRVGVECLERMHLTHQPVDVSMSARWFRAFLDDLDPKRMYFLQADEDEFRSLEKRLGNLAEAGDFDFPRRVRQRYEVRVAQAAVFAEHWLTHQHDYSVDEVYAIRFEDYADGDTELRERWRLRVKFELLIEKVHGVAREDAETQLRGRYERIARDAREMTDERLCAVFLNSLARCYDPHCEYWSPTYLVTFHISLVRPCSLGIFLQKSRGEWMIRSVDPSFSNRARIDGDLRGWHLVAIRRVDGPSHDIQEMAIEDLNQMISSHKGPLGTDTEVILELVDPVTFCRRSIRWVRSQG